MWYVSGGWFRRSLFLAIPSCSSFLAYLVENLAQEEVGIFRIFKVSLEIVETKEWILAVREIVVFFVFFFQISFPNMTLRKIHIPYSNLVLDAISFKSILLGLI